MNMYRVELAWRYAPPAPRKPYYATATYAVMAESESAAVKRAANGLSKDGDVTNIRGEATIVWGVTSLSVLPKRCKASDAFYLPEVTL